jgi:hypothetical protein
MKIFIFYRLISVTVDFADSNKDFAILVYFIRKIINGLDGDSNPRPFGFIFSIKTPKCNVAFTDIRNDENGLVNYEF